MRDDQGLNAGGVRIFPLRPSDVRGSLRIQEDILSSCCDESNCDIFLLDDVCEVI